MATELFDSHVRGQLIERRRYLHYSIRTEEAHVYCARNSSDGTGCGTRARWFWPRRSAAPARGHRTEPRGRRSSYPRTGLQEDSAGPVEQRIKQRSAT